MPTQFEKATALRALHTRPGTFIIANAWDAGSAKLLSGQGFEAIATSSAGLAYTLGKADGQGLVTREETFQNAQAIVNATHLPVSADLENGYGDDPQACADTIIAAAKLGLAGGSIEDATGKAGTPIYDFELSVARIRAAVEAARSLDFPFVLTARAENLIHGKIDLADTIRRLIAYADAGADVLFAPGLQTLEDVAAVVNAVAPKPVNVLISQGLFATHIKDLEALGVKRVSLGGMLARAAYSACFHGAAETQQQGSFTFAKNILSYPQLNALLGAQ